MTEHWRQRRIAELYLRFRPIEVTGGHGVLDVEALTPPPHAGPYETAEMARTQCRTMFGKEIELLYLMPEANFRARVATIIREHTDPEWAAQLIWDYASGSKK